jgi:hypothetical protein
MPSSQESSSSEPKPKAVPRDLRAELKANLETEFREKLEAQDTLPEAVSSSLVALLSTDNPTNADVLAALVLEDSVETEVGQ